MEVSPRPRTKGRGIDDIGKKINFEKEIGGMKFMALCDAVMLRGHDFIPISLVKEFYEKRLEIAKEFYKTQNRTIVDFMVGKQSNSDIHHMINKLDTIVLQRYDVNGRKLKKGSKKEAIHVRIMDHIEPRSFYLEARKTPAVRKFLIDHKKVGLKVARLTPHLQPPKGLLM